MILTQVLADYVALDVEDYVDQEVEVVCSNVEVNVTWMLKMMLDVEDDIKLNVEENMDMNIDDNGDLNVKVQIVPDTEDNVDMDVEDEACLNVEDVVLMSQEW
jgi:hypothetical protein